MPRATRRLMTMLPLWNSSTIIRFVLDILGILPIRLDPILPMLSQFWVLRFISQQPGIVICYPPSCVISKAPIRLVCTSRSDHTRISKWVSLLSHTLVVTCKSFQMLTLVLILPKVAQTLALYLHSMVRPSLGLQSYNDWLPSVLLRQNTLAMTEEMRTATDMAANLHQLRIIDDLPVHFSFKMSQQSK